MDNKFSYSAKEAEEAKRIRKEFVSDEKSDMDTLKEICAMTKRKATIPSIVIGVISALVFGTGMFLVLLDLPYFALGIFIGAIGLIGMGLSYVLYGVIFKREKQKVEGDIISLTDKIISGQGK